MTKLKLGPIVEDKPVKVMLLLVVIALVGVVAGFFNPGLSY